MTNSTITPASQSSGAPAAHRGKMAAVKHAHALHRLPAPLPPAVEALIALLSEIAARDAQEPGA